MAIKLQKFQRLAIRAAEDAVKPYDCIVLLDKARPGCHLKVFVIHLSGRKATIGVASSPKNAEHAIRATAKEAAKKAKELKNG